jgi:hypothetical protein
MFACVFVGVVDTQQKNSNIGKGLVDQFNGIRHDRIFALHVKNPTMELPTFFFDFENCPIWKRKS